jgi:hypothetical protein
MKNEYDFSGGERGRFFKPDAEINLPVYLNADVFAFVQNIAKKKNSDVSVVVNQLIHSDMQIAECVAEEPAEYKAKPEE